MSAPSVAIIIPCHNYGRFLARAIESALAQTYEYTTVTVIDDGSTDDTVQVARRYKSQIELVVQPNAGVERTCNMAVARTTADYIVRLDADDSISPLYVEILLAAVRAAKATFAYSDMLYVGDRSFGGPPEVFRAKPFSVWSLMRMNYVNASAMVGRRAFLDVGGYREPNADAEDVFHEDWDLWLRLAALGHRGVHVRRPLLFYRQHEFGNRSHAWRHPDTIGRLVTAMQRQNPRLYRKVGYRLSSRQPFANILTRITNDPAPSVARLIDATVLAF